jgi:hypothetical protein
MDTVQLSHTATRIRIWAERFVVLDPTSAVPFAGPISGLGTMQAEVKHRSTEAAHAKAVWRGHLVMGLSNGRSPGTVMAAGLAGPTRA